MGIPPCLVWVGTLPVWMDTLFVVLVVLPGRMDMVAVVVDTLLVVWMVVVDSQLGRDTLFVVLGVVGRVGSYRLRSL